MPPACPSSTSFSCAETRLQTRADVPLHSDNAEPSRLNVKHSRLTAFRQLNNLATSRSVAVFHIVICPRFSTATRYWLLGLNVAALTASERLRVTCRKSLVSKTIRP